MNARFQMLLIFCLLGFGLAGMVIIRGTADVHQEDATPIQVGVMTEKQRAHSKLFGNYKTNRKLDALPVPGENDKALEQGVYIEPGTPVTSPDAPELSFEDFLRDTACASDTVAIVDVKDKSSQLTENREFIFTDYTAVVQQVFKDNALSPVRTGNTITVTRPGGKVQINGQVINALDSSFKLLKKEKRYLLFLKYIPGLDVYQSIRQGSFRLEDNELTALSEEFLPGGSDDTRPFTIDVPKALASGCSR
jgi:hypothetical protein